MRKMRFTEAGLPHITKKTMKTQLSHSSDVPYAIYNIPFHNVPYNISKYTSYGVPYKSSN